MATLKESSDISLGAVVAMLKSETLPKKLYDYIFSFFLGIGASETEN